MGRVCCLKSWGSDFILGVLLNCLCWLSVLVDTFIRVCNLRVSVVDNRLSLCPTGCKLSSILRWLPSQLSRQMRLNRSLLHLLVITSSVRLPLPSLSNTCLNALIAFLVIVGDSPCSIELLLLIITDILRRLGRGNVPVFTDLLLYTWSPSLLLIPFI